MFRYGFLPRLLLALLLLVVLAAGGALLYRAGVSQGYAAGLAAANPSGTGNTTPLPPYGIYPYGHFWPGFGFPFFFAPFGLLIGFGFFLLVILLVRSLFRPWGWGPRHRWGYPSPWGYGPGYGPQGPQGPQDQPGHQPEKREGSEQPPRE